MERLLEEINVHKLTNKQQREIIEKLQNNEVLILPTDTIYGLSLIAKNNDPEILNTLKHADKAKPLITLIPNFKAIKHEVIYDKQSLRFLKGKNPVTVVFASKHSQKTRAYRISRRKDLRKILKKVGPIYSTSVNLANKPALTTQEELASFLPNEKNFYWVGPLPANPSKIYNAITKEWIR